MSQNSLKIMLSLCLAVAFILQPATIDAACNVCSEFGIACINETAFNLCQNKIPKTDRAYVCPSAKQCSDTKTKCVAPDAGVTPTCESNTGTCGVCDGVKMFACTSRTTFVQCDGVTATNVTGRCSRGLVCDSQSGELCKNECSRPAVLECDIDAAL